MLLPVGSHLVQAVVAAEDHEIEDVLLEAAAAKAGADGAGHLLHVGAGGFAEGGDAVDRAGGVCSGWARKALAVSLESSLLQRLVRRMRSAGTHWPPINTRSGLSRSLMAVPSARSSGLESTEKVLLPAGDSVSAALRMVVITSAVRTGRVLFPPRSCGPGCWRPADGSIPFCPQAGCSTGVIGSSVSIVLVSLIWE